MAVWRVGDDLVPDSWIGTVASSTLAALDSPQNEKYSGAIDDLDGGFDGSLALNRRATLRESTYGRGK